MRTSGIFICAAVAMVAVGCGQSNMAPVSGTLTLDGKPVAGATVIFQLQPAGRPVSHAATDAQGRFELITEEKANGALIGKHKVAVRKLELIGVPEGEEGLSGLSYPGQVQEVWHTPEKYGSLDTTDLEVEVKPDMSPVKIELKSDKP